MERTASGGSVFRLAMERYEAGTSALTVPRLMIAQNESGSLGFAGRLLVSGPFPGGSATNLLVPIDGGYSAGELTLWQTCTDLRFERLEIASLRFEDREIRLCPPRGRPILGDGRAGLRIAAGVPSLDLEGHLAQTPIRLAAGPVGFAYPGVMVARNIDVALGPPSSASRFRISHLDARLGGNLAGRFEDAEVSLVGVPLDLRDLAGQWDYSRGKLTLSDAGFRLLDRQEPDRFEPLVARGAALTLYDNRIEAHASLRNPDNRSGGHRGGDPSRSRQRGGSCGSRCSRGGVWPSASAR